MDLPDTYFDTNMAFGESRRHPHICSKQGDKPIVVTRTDKGWAWWCHRCRIGGNKYIKGCSPAETMRWLKSLKVKPQKTQAIVSLPQDYTTILPPAALSYCYIREVMEPDIKQYRFGYSLYLHRLILPVYTGKDKLVFWQGRNLGETTRNNPKYMNVSKQDRKEIYFFVPFQDCKTLVITEDIISAIRVGKVVNALAVLSAHIPDKLIFKLALKGKFDTILIWLDPDKKVKATGWAFKYRSYGINCHRIDSDKDPKWYSQNEIGRKICFHQKSNSI